MSVMTDTRHVVAPPKPRLLPVTFVTWKWNQPGFRTTYTAEHVNIWASMLRRMYVGPYRAICITDDPRGIEDCETYPLWRDHENLRNPSGPHLPSCYRRLKIFSPLTTAEMDIDEGAPVVSTDLDVVFTGGLNDVVEKYPMSTFVGWRGVGVHNPAVYNGTIFRFYAGMVNFLWDDFDPVKSPLEANRARYFGSDQSWLSYKLAGSAPGWGAVDGVLSYTSNLGQRSMKSGVGRAVLPSNARIVSFNGKRKPWEPAVLQASPWIEKFYYRRKS